MLLREILIHMHACRTTWLTHEHVQRVGLLRDKVAHHVCHVHLRGASTAQRSTLELHMLAGGMLCVSGLMLAGSFDWKPVHTQALSCCRCLSLLAALRARTVRKL